LRLERESISYVIIYHHRKTSHPQGKSGPVGVGTVRNLIHHSFNKRRNGIDVRVVGIGSKSGKAYLSCGLRLDLESIITMHSLAEAKVACHHYSLGYG